uniref:Uncharacterized protein n=1 Tax=Schizaphis graminum TaxID=13262 RepID=A0A2S2P2Z0_SCHGA
MSRNMSPKLHHTTPNNRTHQHQHIRQPRIHRRNNLIRLPRSPCTLLQLLLTAQPLPLNTQQLSATHPHRTQLLKATSPHHTLQPQATHHSRTPLHLLHHMDQQLSHTHRRPRHTNQQLNHTAQQLNHTAQQLNHTAQQLRHTLQQPHHTPQQPRHTHQLRPTQVM